MDTLVFEVEAVPQVDTQAVLEVDMQAVTEVDTPSVPLAGKSVEPPGRLINIHKRLNTIKNKLPLNWYHTSPDLVP